MIDGTPSTAFPVIYIYAYDLDMANPNLDACADRRQHHCHDRHTLQIYIRNIGKGTITGVTVQETASVLSET